MKPKKAKKLLSRISVWLLALVIVAFAVSIGTTWVFQDGIGTSMSNRLLKVNAEDVHNDILDASDANILSICHNMADDWLVGVNNADDLSIAKLQSKADEENISEICIVDSSGFIRYSNVSEYIGFDMGDATHTQSKEFYDHLIYNHESEYAQAMQANSDSGTMMKYGGVIYTKTPALGALIGGFLQIGYTPDSFESVLAANVTGMTRNRTVGENGYVLIADKDYKIVSAPKEHIESEGELIATVVTGDNLADRIISGEIADGDKFAAYVYGVSSFCIYNFSEDFYIVSTLPQSEATRSRDVSLYLSLGTLVVIFGALFTEIYLLVKKLVVKDIDSINGSLDLISKGNLNTVVDVHSSAEFSSLSSDINTTVDVLKGYIDKESKRIDDELEFARNIQHTALPTVFPPFHRLDLDIFASMDAAKEVGGDFYDFYFIHTNTIAFLIADVSGKGIPAAMFMMRAKTIIKNYAEQGLDVNEVFDKANKELCEGNDAGMFVTAWLGYIDLLTGLITYVNAGHNPPIIKRATGETEFLKDKANFFLAGFETTKYTKHQLYLKKDDIIYLYTDGVSEATSASEELYGDDRLLNFVKDDPTTDVTALCRDVKASVDGFVGTAPQFDDITMLSLRYRAQPYSVSKVFNADISEIEKATAFVDEEMEKAGADIKASNAIDIALDELMSNICKYGYPDKRKGEIRITFFLTDDPRAIYLNFFDNGIPYNPLKQKDPNTELSAEERDIGGLGIYLVKKSMDDMFYEYKNGQNVLQIKKNLADTTNDKD